MKEGEGILYDPETESVVYEGSFLKDLYDGDGNPL